MVNVRNHRLINKFQLLRLAPLTIQYPLFPSPVPRLVGSTSDRLLDNYYLKKTHWKTITEAMETAYLVEVVSYVHNESTLRSTALAHTTAGLCTHYMRQFSQHFDLLFCSVY